MAGPKVHEDSRQYRTRVLPNNSDPRTDSESTASDAGWNRLSFLHGATADGGSSDMCYQDAAPFNVVPESMEDWREKWRAKQALRRHTVEQGSSTFSWPQKP